MSYVYDPRFPTFQVQGHRFALTWQEDDGASVVLLQDMGNGVWNGWGGTPDVSGTLVETVTPELIMSFGSLYAFMSWCNVEAVRRATLKIALPLPDPADKLARAKYALLALTSVHTDDHNVDSLALPPPPLP